MFERKSVHMCLFLVKNDYLPFMLKRLMVSYYTSMQAITMEHIIISFSYITVAIL